MNCESVLERLDLLHYGELPLNEEDAVHRHLASCPECASSLKQTMRMHEAITAAAPAVPYPMLLDCRRRLRLSLPDSPPPAAKPAWWRMFTPGPSAVAAVLSFVAFLAGRQFPSDSPFFSPSPEKTAYRVRSVEPTSSGRVNLDGRRGSTANCKWGSG